MRHTHILLSCLLMIPAISSAAEIPGSTLRSAAQKGLSLLEKTNPAFIQKGGCNSCHNQMLPAAAQAYAQQRGIPTGPVIAQLPPELNEFTPERIIEGSQRFQKQARARPAGQCSSTAKPACQRLTAAVIPGVRRSSGLSPNACVTD